MPNRSKKLLAAASLLLAVTPAAAQQPKPAPAASAPAAAKPATASAPAAAKPATASAPAAAKPAIASAPAAAAAKPAAPADLKPYTEKVPGTQIAFDMVPIPGGTFKMGSPDKEKGRKKDESPQAEVTVRPFYMSKFEVTWDMYHPFLEIGVKNVLSGGEESGPDALTFPTPPYADETFGYGKDKQPNIAVTWHAAMELARWISAKTGKTYRLPTEAEWEYACRGGTETAYFFGNDAKALGDYAWFDKNGKKRPHLVGQKKPNPFGLYDILGNVSEWVLDTYDAAAYAKAKPGELPVALPGDRRYPHVVRGGSWKEKPAALRCAARRFSEPWWSKQDPQSPQSIWWHTEATEVGFRFVRAVDEYPMVKNVRSKMTVDSLN